MQRLAGWLGSRPDLMARIERFRLLPPDEPAVPEVPTAPSGHVVIVGYGRVGRMVGHGLAAAGTPFAVIDEDRRAVEALRRKGVLAVHGDAIAPGVLGDAGADRAKLIMVTMPECYRTRRIVELIRELNPGIDTAARADTEDEAAEFTRLGVGAVLKPEREVAVGLLGYALAQLRRARGPLGRHRRKREGQRLGARRSAEPGARAACARAAAAPRSGVTGRAGRRLEFPADWR